MKLELGVDLSRYQENLTKELFKQLVDNGMSFVIFKVQGVKQGTSIIVEDPVAATYKEWCLEYGIPYGIYLYLYPGIDYDTQMQFTKAMQWKYSPRITFMDAEEWKNYSTNLPYSPDFLNGFYKKYYVNLQGVKGVYTGDWFIKKYCPKMVEWLKDVDHLWWAWYSRIGLYWPWIALMTSLGWIIPMAKIQSVVSWLENKTPGTMGLKWDIWQFESWMKVKELGQVSSNLYHFDWNVMLKPTHFEIFGTLPVIGEITMPEYNATVNALGRLRIRSTPNGAIIGSYADQEKIFVISEANGWGKTDKGYVGMAYVAKDVVTPPVPTIDEKSIRLNELSIMQTYLDARKAELGRV